MIARAIFILYLWNREEGVVPHVRGIKVNTESTLIIRAFFRGDDDGTIHTTSSINRRSSRTFQHCVGVNIIRANIPRVGINRYTIYHIKDITSSTKRDSGCTNKFSRRTYVQASYFAHQRVDRIRLAGFVKLTCFHLLSSITNF